MYTWVMARFRCTWYMALWPWPLTLKLGHVMRIMRLIYLPILKFTGLRIIEIGVIKRRVSGVVARQPALPWEPFCVPLVGGGPICYNANMKLIWRLSTEIRHIIAVYIIWPCDLDLWQYYALSFFTDLLSVCLLCFMTKKRYNMLLYWYVARSLILHYIRNSAGFFCTWDAVT